MISISHGYFTLQKRTLLAKLLALDLTLRYEIKSNNDKVPSLMTLYEPWILYKVFHSINLHVYTPRTPRSESYFGSHRGDGFLFS